jgi:hypothetical protein
MFLFFSIPKHARCPLFGRTPAVARGADELTLGDFVQNDLDRSAVRDEPGNSFDLVGRVDVVKLEQIDRVRRDFFLAVVTFAKPFGTQSPRGVYLDRVDQVLELLNFLALLNSLALARRLRWVLALVLPLGLLPVAADAQESTFGQLDRDPERG